MEKLEALAAAGLNTPEKLAEAGITELRQNQAIASLVTGLPGLKRIMGAIKKQAVPGLLGGLRGAVETEMPTTSGALAIERAKATFQDVTAFGPQAVTSQEAELRERARAIVYRRRGLESALGINLIDDVTGRAGGFFGNAALAVESAATMSPRGQQLFLESLSREVDALVKEFRGAAENISRASSNLERATGGGPTRQPAPSSPGAQ